MTRAEAITTAKTALPKGVRRQFRQLVAMLAWGGAATLVFDTTGRADLSDAIWTG